MTETAQFNNSYAFIASEVERQLKEAQTPLASDNKHLSSSLGKTLILMAKFANAIERWEATGSQEGLNQLKIEIINSKKCIENDN